MARGRGYWPGGVANQPMSNQMGYPEQGGGIRGKHRARGVPPQGEDLEEVDKCPIIGDHIHCKGTKYGNHKHREEE